MRLLQYDLVGEKSVVCSFEFRAQSGQLPVKRSGHLRFLHSGGQGFPFLQHA